MLNPFPILFLSLLGHAVLRIVAGGLLVFLGLSQLGKEKRVGLKKALFGGFVGGSLFGLMLFLELVGGRFFVTASSRCGRRSALRLFAGSAGHDEDRAERDATNGET